MKNTIKLFEAVRSTAIVAFVAIIGFSMAACDDGSVNDKGNGNGGNQTPLESHYSFGNRNQTEGNAITAVTITPNSDASPGAVYNIRYDGGTEIPQTAGTYAVTFDVAEAAGWYPVTGLSAGNLVVGNRSNQTPNASHYTFGNTNQTAGNTITAVTITRNSNASSGAVSNIRYNGNAAVPQTPGTYAVTFDVAAATGWNPASGLSAGNLVVNPGNQTPNASHYTFGNTNQTAGSVTAVTITRNSSASPGAVSNIRYNGNAAVPQTAGTYAVTFDVSAATGWNFASGLSAGNLVVGENYVWLVTKQSTYSVTNGEAGPISSETVTNWITYSPTEQKSSYATQQNTEMSIPGSYTQTQTVSTEGTNHNIRDGQTYVQSTSSISDSTTTLVYDSATYQYLNRKTRTVTESESTTTYVYHLETGLMEKQTQVTTGTTTTTVNDGTPTVTPTATNTETSYTIELQSDADGVKTYKQTITTGITGIGFYSIVKMQNGVTLETSSYTSDGVLSSIITYDNGRIQEQKIYGVYTLKYTYTDNMTQSSYYDANDSLVYTSTSTVTDNVAIRAKLPNFRIANYDYPAYYSQPGYDTYFNYSETVEILSDSATVLEIRVKRFSRSHELLAQTDTRYERITSGHTSGGGNQIPTAIRYTFGNMIQTEWNVTAVTITPNSNASPGAVSNIRYNGSAAIPQTTGIYAVTFDVAAATGWNAATGLSAGYLIVNPANQNPNAGHYTFGNMTQLAGGVTAVTITRNLNASPGAVSNIRYNGSAAIPQTAGNYAVTFDVAAATGWNAATGLSAGNLVVNPRAALTITNLPSGNSTIAVHSITTAPATYQAYNQINSSTIIASGAGSSSPVTLSPNITVTGSRLVIIMNGSGIRLIVANFTNGSATVNWNTMTNPLTLPWQ